MSDVAAAELDAAQNAILATSTTYYLSLHTADPGQTGASEGPDGRQAITFGASSSGSQVSNSAQTWSGMAGGHTYTNFGVWTAATGGTYLRGGSLSQQLTPSAGGGVSVASGSIDFTAS